MLNPPARLPACPPARLPACPPARLPACPSADFGHPADLQRRGGGDRLPAEPGRADLP
ncbi:MAG: hypothetical protein MZW92_21395 [Comamonadaceae bacterium]|nr:hypothetical protein [Comamonadaceae bacterium]